MTRDLVIVPGRTALLVHDVVNHFAEHGTPEFDTALGNIDTLAKAARAAGVPVVFATPGAGDPSIRQRVGAGGDRVLWGSQGADVIASLGPEPSDVVIRKPRFGAFFGSELAAWLQSERRDVLLVCGISLAGGVETTIRDGYNRDLAFILATDACVCRGIPDQGWGPISRDDVARVTLSILAQRFTTVAATNEICRALRGL